MPFQRYLAYAKTYVKPRLSEEASQSLIHAYVTMRKVGSGSGKVTAYPRQLESMIRFDILFDLFGKFEVDG